MLVGVGIDPKKNNVCLTREEEGVFFWSKKTMIKLGEKASDIFQQRQMKLGMCMIDLTFHNLMLDMDESLSEGCFFEMFMYAFNLA